MSDDDSRRIMVAVFAAAAFGTFAGAFAPALPEVLRLPATMTTVLIVVLIFRWAVR